MTASSILLGEGVRRCVLVDTAAWLACADSSDPNRAAACAARDRLLEEGRLLVTTDYIADESLTLIRSRMGQDAASRWWRQVDGSPRLRWELVTEDRFDRAIEMFMKFRDKNFSFTDCTSFVVMRDLGLSRALTLDSHFRQMGFQTIPRLRA